MESKPAYQYERHRNYRERNRKAVLAYLKEHACVDCGENDIRVLEFDHVRGEKRMNISDFGHSTFSLKTLFAEIEKCAVRCANCHRKKTFDAVLVTKGIVVGKVKGRLGE